MMKEPNEADYDVKLGVGAVEVTFNPTSSHFVYNSTTVLVDPQDNAPPTIITSPNGDTYWSNAVQAMARRLALKRLPRRRRTKKNADWCSDWCRFRIDLHTLGHRPNPKQHVRSADHDRSGRCSLY